MNTLKKSVKLLAIMEETYTYELKIPKERIAVLIGTKGKTKRRIEGDIGIVLDVDSKEGDVFLYGEDAINLFNAREVIKAIGRGFNPDIAMQLLKPDYMFESLRLNDYANSKANEIRLKGRIIGKEGKARKNLEELTDTNIIVYGKTISFIGPVENIVIAKKAIESLLSGSRHATVYKWLEQSHRKRKRAEFGYLRREE